MLVLIALLLGVFILAMVAGSIHNRRINRKIAKGELSQVHRSGARPAAGRFHPLSRGRRFCAAAEP